MSALLIILAIVLGLTALWLEVNGESRFLVGLLLSAALVFMVLMALIEDGVIA